MQVSLLLDVIIIHTVISHTTVNEHLRNMNNCAYTVYIVLYVYTIETKLLLSTELFLCW